MSPGFCLYKAVSDSPVSPDGGLPLGVSRSRREHQPAPPHGVQGPVQAEGGLQAGELVLTLGETLTGDK